MKSHPVSIVLVFFFILSACSELPSANSEAIKKTRQAIDSLQTDQQVPGIQLSVWKSGELVLSEGFGYADLEQNVPLTADTKLRIGSVSKTLTSVALGKLYEEGKMDFNATVQQYTPYFPEKRYPITVRQVAGHVGGIRHYRGDEFLLNKQFHSVRESLEIFADDTLLFEPGTDYSYSSYGWNLISAVIEEAAGEPFLAYMESEILERMKMNETVPEYPDSLIDHRTQYYGKGENGVVVNAPTVNNSYKWAGGGFIGTTEDLIDFGTGIFWEDFLQPETVDLLIASQTLTNGEKTNYGIGWRSGIDKDGRTYYGHSGGSVGGTTQFVVYPEQEIIVAVIANMRSVSYGDTHHRIAEFFMTNPDEE